MEIYEIILGIVLIIASLILVVTVILQEGRSAGLSGAIAGGAETFLGKGKSKTIDQKLAKITKIVAILFFVITILATAIAAFLK